MPNTRVEYRYQDALNYKTYESIVMKGSLTKAQINALFEKYGEGCVEGFIPSQIGLADLQPNLQQYDSRDWGNDHCFHDLSEIEETNDDPTVNMTAKQFYRLMMDTNWEPFEVCHPMGE